MGTFIQVTAGGAGKVTGWYKGTTQVQVVKERIWSLSRDIFKLRLNRVFDWTEHHFDRVYKYLQVSLAR